MSQASSLGLKAIAFNAGNSHAWEDFIVEHVPPDLRFSRTQPSQLPTIKDRAVHCRPLHVVLLEGLFAHPWNEAILSDDTDVPIAAGFAPLGLYRKLLCLGGFLRYISIDWDAFVKRTETWELYSAINILAWCTIVRDNETRIMLTFITWNLLFSRLLLPTERLFHLHLNHKPQKQGLRDFGVWGFGV